MDDSSDHRAALVDALEDLESPASELGTPVLAQSRDLDELVALGPTAVPQLLSRLEDQPAKIVAYLVSGLNRIGDRRALGALRDLRSRYEALEPKDKWELAVIGQCNLAIQALE